MTRRTGKSLRGSRLADPVGRPHRDAAWIIPISIEEVHPEVLLSTHVCQPPLRL